MTPMKRPAFQQVAGDLVMRRPQMQDSSLSSSVHHASSRLHRGRPRPRHHCVTTPSSTPMFPLSIAESSGHTLAPTTVSASSLPDLVEGGPVMVDISNFTAAKILDERPSPSGVEYRCELEPLWLTATDVYAKSRNNNSLVCARCHDHCLVRELSLDI
jgi:hypothetical protein